MIRPKTCFWLRINAAKTWPGLAKKAEVLLAVARRIHWALSGGAIDYGNGVAASADVPDAVHHDGRRRCPSARNRRL